MLTEERKEFILKTLNQCGFVKSTTLAEELATSLSTIRRDLQELEDEGLIQRIHGGAKTITPLLQEETMSEKASKNIAAKRQIAALAIDEIKPNDVIFIDAGTTTFEMIPLLKDRSVTVVTNSVIHASALAEEKITTIILGGMIKKDTQAIVTTTAFEQLQHFRFDKSFVGVNSITHFGYATPDIEEAQMKQLAINHSQKRYILGDSTKFTHSSFVKFADLDEAIILTDELPSDCEKIKTITTVKEAKI